MMAWSEEESRDMETENNNAKRIEPALDLIESVKRLHGHSSEELSKLIKESENITLQEISENGSPLQINASNLARYLCLHLIAASLAWRKDKVLFRYLLSGIRLLHSLYDLAPRHPKISQILLDDTKISEQLMHLGFYMIVASCSYRQSDEIQDDMAPLHSTIVASSLYLFKAGFSSHWNELSQVLLSYKKVDMLMDASFSAVRHEIQFLQSKLSTEYVGSCSDSIPPTEDLLSHLCQQCEASVQFLQSLCQQKPFCERLVKNKELCGKGGILLFARSILVIRIPDWLHDSSPVVASVSRLKSRVLSILIHLCEADNVSYLDEVAGNPESLDLAKSIAFEVVELLRKMFGSDLNQSSDTSEKVIPRGQLQLNAMRLTDIFSDDSNFRAFITKHLTEIFSATFLLPHGEFVSKWCSSSVPICEEDAILEYNQFAAAGWVLNPFSSDVPVNQLNSDSSVVPGNLPKASYAYERTALLVKIIANLHCYLPHMRKEEKDLFLNMLVECLQKGVSSVSTTEIAAANVKRNLNSLFSHGASLIPCFLNEEDVQLLRLFANQVEPYMVAVQAKDHQQHGSKFEGSASWDKFSKLNISEHQEAQSTERYSSPQQLEAARDNNRNGNGREDMSENYGFQEFRSSNKRRSSDSGRRGRSNSRRGVRRLDNETNYGETSGSNSSSTRERNPVDQVNEGAIVIHDDEKIETTPHEKQQRKRKRTLMNDLQIELAEKALREHPDMQRNLNLLKFYAESLSAHGPEVSTSQLKNWLNNRKARLARAAKDGNVRVHYEGESAEKQLGGSGMVIPYDSPTSPTMGSTGRGNNGNGVGDPTVRICSNNTNTNTNEISGAGLVQCDPGQYVVLVNENLDEIGKAKVFQVNGEWCGWNLDTTRTFVVDITDLRVERFAKLPYPSSVTGSTFDQAEEILGFMRVLWDSNKILDFPPR